MENLGERSYAENSRKYPGVLTKFGDKLLLKVHYKPKGPCLEIWRSVLLVEEVAGVRDGFTVPYHKTGFVYLPLLFFRISIVSSIY